MEEVLIELVAKRKYDVRYLLYGLMQHDVYHLGQIAYVKKMIVQINMNKFNIFKR